MILFVKTGKKCKKTKAEIFKDLKQKESIRIKYYQHIAKSGLVDGVEWVDGILCPFTSDPALLELFILNELEQEGEFNGSFLRLCKDNGCNITEGKENDTCEKEFANDKKSINKMFRGQV